MEETRNEKRLAVLIDADNASKADLQLILEEVTRFGTPTIKRAYGDWSSSVLSGWKDVLLNLGAVAVQQYAYTKGKNATDAAMIIDAMDFLHSGRVDGFVLISSDSDFTPLALRIREAGLLVVGVGEEKTPAPFVTACDVFRRVEVLRQVESAKNTDKKPASTGPSKKTISFIAQTISEYAEDDGWCHLSGLGSGLVKKRPDFDCRKYGYSQLSKLLRAIPRFEVKVEENTLVVRDRQSQS